MKANIVFYDMINDRGECHTEEGEVVYVHGLNVLGLSYEEFAKPVHISTVWENGVNYVKHLVFDGQFEGGVH